MDADAISATQNYYNVMSKRRSIRHFSSDLVEADIILNAIKTAGTAPSGANRQPWHFAVIQDATLKRKLRDAAEQVEHKFYHQNAPKQWIDDLKALGTNHLKPYLTDAPSIIAVFHRTHTYNENDELTRTYYPLESTGIAVGLLISALHQAGLATLTHTPKPMSFLNELLKFDKSYRPFMLVITGHPAHDASVPDIKRKPLDEIMTIH